MAKKENPTTASINTLNEHIKTGNFSRLYVLTGSEGYFLKQYKKALMDALTTPDDTMNVNIFAGEKVTPEAVIEAASTMPFFADHRTVLVEGTGLLKKSPDNLISFLEDLPDSTILIFVETEVDARTKIYKTVNKIGTVAKFETPDSNMLNLWVKKQLAADGATVSDKAVFSLINSVGQDMNRLANEAAKLRAYCIDKKEITEADVARICENEAEDKVFAMLDAISQHDSRKALTLYSDLEQLKVQPMMTLALIRKRFIQLSQIKMMLKDREDFSTISKYTGVIPFYVKDYVHQAESFDQKSLIRYSEMCADANLDITSGRSTDKQALEMLILKLCLR